MPLGHIWALPCPCAEPAARSWGASVDIKGSFWMINCFFAQRVTEITGSQAAASHGPVYYQVETHFTCHRAGTFEFYSSDAHHLLLVPTLPGWLELPELPRSSS